MSNDVPVSKVFLIPSFLDENALQTIPPYVADAVKQCRIFFVENERSARRYLKKIWKEMVIDDYRWVPIHKAEAAVIKEFQKALKENLNIGIISEAGCPGVADPGQLLITAAHQHNADVVPLVGPSSILLALMASGLNGQQFTFNGYLPIDAGERTKMLRQLETESQKKNATQIFIETPYRNNQLLEAIVRSCKPETKLCVAVSVTSRDEWIKTLSINEWKKQLPDLHKKPTVFLLLA